MQHLHYSCTSFHIVPSVPWIFSQLTRFRFDFASALPGRVGGGGGGTGIPPCGVGGGLGGVGSPGVENADTSPIAAAVLVGVEGGRLLDLSPRLPIAADSCSSKL